MTAIKGSRTSSAIMQPSLYVISIYASISLDRRSLFLPCNYHCTLHGNYHTRIYVVFLPAILYRCCSSVGLCGCGCSFLSHARALSSVFVCAISFFSSCHILPHFTNLMHRHARTFSLSLRRHARTSRQHVDANLFRTQFRIETTPMLATTSLRVYPRGQSSVEIL